jgi:hypothetical protein
METKNMNFGDKRLIKRAEKILEALSENSEGSIPEACITHAETIGAYRFFDNKKATSETIMKGFCIATKERIASQKEILFISDSTSFVFTGRKTLTGTGVLRNFKARGLIMHSTLAVANNVALGLIKQKSWGRKPEDYGKRIERKSLPIEQRESFKWIEHMREAHGIYICDREADMIDLFMEKRNSNFDLLIRSNYNRKLVGSPLKLHAMLSNLPVMGSVNVPINRSGKRKPRNATLELKYTEVNLFAEKKPTFTINVIEALEINITEKLQDPVAWRLFTTGSVNSLEDAIKYVHFYTQRWLIERFHFALKSGCQIEELQLESDKRMFAAIALYCIVAWRIMSITYFARYEPNRPSKEFFDKPEWEGLCCFYNQNTVPPKKCPPIKQAVLMLAKLGGFLDRKGDGEPGMKVLWRGLRRLEGFVNAYNLFARTSVRCV